MNYLFYDKNLIYPENKNEYSPSEMYPEYPFKNISLGTEPNSVYTTIRKMFYLMELDRKNYGTEKWNPLGKWIKPGMKVCLKPNFVMHKNGSNNPDDLDSLVTHPSIIRCILDYCYIALEGKGTVIVGDSPVKDCDFNLLMKRRNYIDIVNFYNKVKSDFKVKFYDFRGPEEEGGQYNSKGKGILVNLGEKSWFYADSKNANKYRIPNYHYKRVIKHHNGLTQEYLINSIVLDADVIISIPKPKTHRKNGYTAALKNFVGVSYSKEYLPHHTEGSVKSGGDEYIVNGLIPRLTSTIRKYIDINRVKIDRKRKENPKSFLLNINNKTSHLMWILYNKINKLDSLLMKYRKASLAESAREGTWYGNDTLWRTVLDLNYILKYSTNKGEIKEKPQRTILHFGDMIISGEKEGPMAPSPKEQHMLLFSDDVVDFDCIVTKIMGFDYKKFKGLYNAVGFYPLTKNKYEQIELKSNVLECNGLLDLINFRSISKPFVAGKGWRGHIEL